MVKKFVDAFGQELFGKPYEIEIYSHGSFPQASGGGSGDRASGRKEGQEQLRALHRPGLEQGQAPQASDRSYRYQLWAWCVHDWERGPEGVCAKCGDNPVDHLKRNERNLEAFWPKGSYARAFRDLGEAWREFKLAILQAFWIDRLYDWLRRKLGGSK